MLEKLSLLRPKLLTFTDLAWILATGAAIHYVATAVYWLPFVWAGCVSLP